MARAQRVNAGTVRVSGMRELNKALREVSKETQGELKEASRGVAEFVASDSRSAAQSLGGVAAKTAPSISPVGGVKGAGVALGGARFPFAGGAEFGSVRFKQFKPWRGNSSGAGYFVYPSIRRNAERIEDEFTAAVEALLKRAGLS